jgi:hypothetical protein
VKPSFDPAKLPGQPEKRTLIWLAARTPAWINSDHLTLLGCFPWGRWRGLLVVGQQQAGLILVVLCLALNWLGDSLDGTLARFRTTHAPAMAFALTTLWMLSAFFPSAALRSPDSWRALVALGLLIAYLMLSVEIYRPPTFWATSKSLIQNGPTELRILLSIGNLAVLWKSTVHLLGRAHRLFDVAGTLGISGMLLIMVISAVRNTVRLYRQEPIHVRKPARTQKQLPLGLEKTSPALRPESKTANALRVPS